MQRREHVKRRHNWPGLKQVWVIADLAQLHQAVHQSQVIATGKRGPSCAGGHVLLVQQPLTLGQRAVHHVFVLAGQLLFDITFEPAQKKRPQHSVQALDNGAIHLQRGAVSQNGGDASALVGFNKHNPVYINMLSIHALDLRTSEEPSTIPTSGSENQFLNWAWLANT